jgi:hypothetical protein
MSASNSIVAIPTTIKVVPRRMGIAIFRIQASGVSGLS